MIYSMTGYGRAVECFGGKEISVELRSVNNRFLDLNIRLPRALSYAEEAVRSAVKKRVSRGKVDVFIGLGGTDEEPARISLNRPLLEGYLQALRAMSEEYSLHDDVTVMSLARLPELLTVEKPEQDEEKQTAELLGVVEKALDAFTAMRATEGAAMETDLRSRAAKIEHSVSKIEACGPERLREYRMRLETKVHELLGASSIDESRLLTEVAIYADKIAVDEETVRLRSHLAQFDSLLTAGGMVGKKLDFLLPEMLRETNTIGSKSNDVTQTRCVLEIKNELEKLREQVQNIE